MNKDEVPKKQKGSSNKTNIYYNQEQTHTVKTSSFLGHLNPDIVFTVIANTYPLFVNPCSLFSVIFTNQDKSF